MCFCPVYVKKLGCGSFQQQWCHFSGPQHLYSSISWSHRIYVTCLKGRNLWINLYFRPWFILKFTSFQKREFDEHSTQFCDLCKINVKIGYGGEGNWKKHIENYSSMCWQWLWVRDWGYRLRLVTSRTFELRWVLTCNDDVQIHSPTMFVTTTKLQHNHKH